MKEDSFCIRMKGIDKSFGGKQVLHQIDLSIPFGGIYGLLGPSGCGKTTTVKIMAGILESETGETLILGEPMPNLQMMNKIGYMAQSDALYSNLSGKENLEFFGALYGMDKKSLAARITEVMALVNLDEDMDKVVSAYSGGMKRRLSLAAAILHNPPVLILDEPTVGIDPLLRKSIWEELYRMTKRGITILVTTHVMDEAEKCTHLAMMRGGFLISVGTPAELILRSGTDTLEQAFIHYGMEGNQ
jgi:ABC-2 type transport system ATP-binding protein